MQLPGALGYALSLDTLFRPDANGAVNRHKS